MIRLFKHYIPHAVLLLGLAWQLRVVGMTRLAGLLLIALAAQISLGVSNVAFGLPLPVAVDDSGRVAVAEGLNVCAADPGAGR